MLQLVIKDSTLGPSSDWDHFLALTLDDASIQNVPHEEFLKNTPVTRVLQKCQISTPSKFLVITQKLLISFISSLLGNRVIKSDILRGLSSFDFDVLLSSPSSVYTNSISCLVDYFIATKHFPASDRGIVISEYKSYVCYLRSCDVTPPVDPIHFFINDWELQSRASLYTLFKLSCCCCSLVPDFGPEVSFDLPGMGMRSLNMTSLLRCLQTGLPWLTDVSSVLYSDASLTHLQDLIRDQEQIFPSSDFSVWSYFRKADRSSLLRRLQSLNRKFDPNLPSSSSVAPSPTGTRKISKKDEPTSKRSRTGSILQSSAAGSSVPQSSPSTSETLGLFGVEVFKAPTGKFTQDKQ